MKYPGQRLIILYDCPNVFSLRLQFDTTAAGSPVDCTVLVHVESETDQIMIEQ